MTPSQKRVLEQASIGRLYRRGNGYFDTDVDRRYIPAVTVNSLERRGWIEWRGIVAAVTPAGLRVLSGRAA